LEAELASLPRVDDPRWLPPIYEQHRKYELESREWSGREISDAAIGGQVPEYIDIFGQPEMAAARKKADVWFISASYYAEAIRMNNLHDDLKQTEKPDATELSRLARQISECLVMAAAGQAQLGRAPGSCFAIDPNLHSEQRNFGENVQFVLEMAPQ